MISERVEAVDSNAPVHDMSPTVLKRTVASKTLSPSIDLRNGDSAINIRSFYESKIFDSSKEFECGAGAIIAGVSFKADIVKLK